MSQHLFTQLIDQAKNEANKHHVNISISCVDDSGLLRNFIRMDDAVAGSVDVAIKKARTAALFGTNSLELGQYAQPGGSIYTLEHTNGGLISFGGGVVVKDAQGKILGALGVAGATVELDQEIAVAAVEKVMKSV